MQRLWAKALVIKSPQRPPALLITLDNCLIPAYLRGELASRLQRHLGLHGDRITITATHTHNGPILAEWEARAKEGADRGGTVGYHARIHLERLDRGESIKTKLPLPVQTWTFSEDLAMVFWGGEAVVDYSLRLKRELDSRRVWIIAYANDVPCYIPSERVLPPSS